MVFLADDFRPVCLVQAQGRQAGQHDGKFHCGFIIFEQGPEGVALSDRAGHVLHLPVAAEPEPGVFSRGDEAGQDPVPLRVRIGTAGDIDGRGGEVASRLPALPEDPPGVEISLVSPLLF